ncbi:MAG: pyrimidine 5'-nucleotidase [Hyphomicrobiaceae bacterium]
MQSEGSDNDNWPTGLPPTAGLPAKPARGFDRTSAWIFDLDNTLYPAECRLFAQIEHRMGEFIARLLDVPYDQAQHLRLNYYRNFGTTLTGLMEVHRIDPGPFLEYVHDIDLAVVNPNAGLRTAIGKLEGRRLIFTNGSRRHAERVAEKVGILDLFEDICDIAACEYTPKPAAEAFDRMVRAHGVRTSEAAMFEDMPHNLEVPHGLGMTTVLVRHGEPEHARQQEIAGWTVPPDHIHHITDDLVGFLGRIEKPAGK